MNNNKFKQFCGSIDYNTYNKIQSILGISSVGMTLTNDLILSHNVTAYRIRNLYVNVLSVSNGDVASRVASYSYTYSSSSK